MPFYALSLNVEEGSVIFTDYSVQDSPYIIRTENLEFFVKAGLDLRMKMDLKADFKDVPFKRIHINGKYDLLKKCGEASGMLFLGDISDICSMPYFKTVGTGIKNSLSSSDLKTELFIRINPGEIICESSMSPVKFKWKSEGQLVGGTARLQLGRRWHEGDNKIFPVNAILNLDDLTYKRSGIDLVGGKFQSQLEFWGDLVRFLSAKIDFNEFHIVGGGLYYFKRIPEIEFKAKIYTSLNFLWEEFKRFKSIKSSWALNGNLSSSVFLKGKYNNPSLNGTVSFNEINAGYDINTPLFKNISGKIRIKNSKIIFKRITGTVRSVPVSAKGVLRTEGNAYKIDMKGFAADIPISFKGISIGNDLILEKGTLQTGNSILDIYGKSKKDSKYFSLNAKGSFDLEKLSILPIPQIEKISPAGILDITGTVSGMFGKPVTFVSNAIGESEDLVVRGAKFNKFVFKSKLKEGKVVIKLLESVLYGGALSGKIKAILFPEYGAWSSRLNVDGVNLAPLMRGLSLSKNIIEGSITVNSVIDSPGPGWDRAEGRWNLCVTGASLWKVRILGGILKTVTLLIPGNGDVDFKQIQGSILLINKQFCTDDLIFSSSILRLLVKGCIGLDRSINLQFHPTMKTVDDSKQSITEKVTGTGLGIIGSPISRFSIEGTLDNYRIVSSVSSLLGGVKGLLKMPFKKEKKKETVPTE
ncbi:MAG: hypothetical protein P9M03_09355 [Candidatus Theseobacter exili]|nr:hypothetical protein [Candidatus Theseobacter exili]